VARVQLLETHDGPSRLYVDGLLADREFSVDVQRNMRPENWLRRRIKPIAAVLGGHTPVNFQVLRRTFATNPQGHGSAKDVQVHLRHADIATTLGIYTQPIDKNVRKLVNAVTDDVMSAKKTGPKPLTTRLQ